jgi:predicted nucleotidyltransferase
VLELPFPRSIASAERFASGAVEALEDTGICTHIIFGSECGSIDPLKRAADALSQQQTKELIRRRAKLGMSYASARQSVLEEMLGSDGSVLSGANNTLGVEYLKALDVLGSKIVPLTLPRRGDHHDSAGCSGMSLRNELLQGHEPWQHIPQEAANIFREEIRLGRGPVNTASESGAILSVLRAHTDFSTLPDASEGLDRRLEKFSHSEPTLGRVLEAAKTKRYAMSRLRRMVLCAYLGVTDSVPIITKPASARRMGGEISQQFFLQARSTDLYALAYPSAEQRFGGQEWTIGPVILP